MVVRQSTVNHLHAPCTHLHLLFHSLGLLSIISHTILSTLHLLLIQTAKSSRNPSSTKVGNAGRPKDNDTTSNKKKSKSSNQSRSAPLLAQDETSKKMNGLPDFSGAASGRVLSHPRFDCTAVTAASPNDNEAAYPGYNVGSLMNMNNRYGYAQAQAAGMDPRLLQQEQELRRGDSFASFGGAPSDNQAALQVQARRDGEDELLRLHDAHNRIMEAELAARAMRDRVAAAQQQAQDRLTAQHQQAAQAHQGVNFRADSIERIVALQEQQAARLREMEQLRQAEMNEQAAGQAGFGAGGNLHHGQQMPNGAAAGAAERDRFLMDAAAYGGRLSNPRTLSIASSAGLPSSAHQAQVLRERRRRGPQATACATTSTTGAASTCTTTTPPGATTSAGELFEPAGLRRGTRAFQPSTPPAANVR